MWIASFSREMKFPRLAAIAVPAIPLNLHSLNQVQVMRICRHHRRFSLIHLQGELSLSRQIGQNTLHNVPSSCKSSAVFCPHSSLFRDGLRTYTSRCTIADDVMPTQMTPRTDDSSYYCLKCVFGTILKSKEKKDNFLVKRRFYQQYYSVYRGSTEDFVPDWSRA